MTDKRLIDYRKNCRDSGEAILYMGESDRSGEMLKLPEGFLGKYPGLGNPENDGRGVSGSGLRREADGAGAFDAGSFSLRQSPIRPHVDILSVFNLFVAVLTGSDGIKAVNSGFK